MTITKAIASAVCCSLLALSGAALAGDLKVGGGLRTSFGMVDGGAPNGVDDSTDFTLESVRLYTSGTIKDDIGFTFNTGYENATNSVEVLDAIARFEFSDEFNVWAGRFLPPSDRSNFSGPYFLGAWNFPILVQRYPNVFAGRDEGVAVWGQRSGGKFKYQLGLFEGPDALVNSGEDETLFAGRLTFNFLDAEPGYYNSSTYFGDKEIFAVGLVLQNFDGGSGNNIDVLYEKALGAGTLTLEASIYSYDEFAGSDGDGSFFLASYLFPNNWQPTFRIQNADIDTFVSADPTTVPPTPSAIIDRPEVDITEVGLNYIIDGHNARISIVYSNTESESLGPTVPATDSDAFIIGLQLQI